MAGIVGTICSLGKPIFCRLQVMSLISAVNGHPAGNYIGGTAP